MCTLNVSLNVAESLRQPPSEFLILSFLSKGRHRPYVFSYEWCTEYNSFRSADIRSRRRYADVDSELLAAMLRSSPKISDLFFSPGKPPLVEISGKLASAGATRVLTNDDTRRIGSDLIGSNQEAIDNLKELGSCDVSYSLPGAHRFRVNVFMQRGSCAVVMRVIPSKIQTSQR